MAATDTVLKPDFGAKRRHFIFTDEHEQLRESTKEVRLPAGVRWAMEFVDQARVGLRTMAEPSWTARVKLHLPTLRAARRHLLDHGRLADICRFTISTAEFSVWRDVEELWTWTIDLLDVPGLDREPRTHPARWIGASLPSSQTVMSSRCSPQTARRRLLISPTVA